MFEILLFGKRDKGMWMLWNVIGKEFRVLVIGDRRNNWGLGFRHNQGRI